MTDFLAKLEPSEAEAPMEQTESRQTRHVNGAKGDPLHGFSDADAMADGARYVAGMLRELGEIARNSGYGFLYYLIDMARLEADSRALERPDGPGRKTEMEQGRIARSRPDS